MGEQRAVTTPKSMQGAVASECGDAEGAAASALRIRQLVLDDLKGRADHLLDVVHLAILEECQRHLIDDQLSSILLECDDVIANVLRRADQRELVRVARAAAAAHHQSKDRFLLIRLQALQLSDSVVAHLHRIGAEGACRSGGVATEVHLVFRPVAVDADEAAAPKDTSTGRVTEACVCAGATNRLVPRRFGRKAPTSAAWIAEAEAESAAGGLA
eukprot:CAMPEP_0176216208 /NCGR_PEP_ID=MMETSP0121_2-20121125/17074_1 /TAXON_ID=160619 /ORGANISM="Kryptoperidinium foliaceum, Strain CCMP 1326" /LENGTH=214 /DNA_ID=CAMNT_0017555331 /DNA_START=108 /DNA_END=749 /DNA_ORIENTATION=-